MRATYAIDDTKQRFLLGIHPDAGDGAPRSGKGTLDPARPDDIFIELPAGMNRLEQAHPDLLALVALLTVGPFVKNSISFGMPVSSPFAEAVASRFGWDVGPVDEALVPRHLPARDGIPALAFSGGVDSCAASVIMPSDTRHYFLLRDNSGRAQKSMYRPEAALASVNAVRASGREIEALKSNLEFARTPVGFPVDWSNAAPAVLSADALSLKSIAFGMILESAFSLGKSQYSELRDRAIYARWAPLFAAVGLPISLPTVALSEVMTSAIVRDAGTHLLPQSCVRGLPGEPCHKCYKCFRKGLMDAALAGGSIDESRLDLALGSREVRARLLEVPIHHEIGIAWALDRIQMPSHPVLAALLQKTAPVRAYGDRLEFLRKTYANGLEYVPQGERQATARSLRVYAPMSGAEDESAILGWDLKKTIEAPQYQRGQAKLESLFSGQAGLRPKGDTNHFSTPAPTGVSSADTLKSASTVPEPLEIRLSKIEGLLEQHVAWAQRAHRAVLREMGKLPGDIVSLQRVVDRTMGAELSAPPPRTGSYALRAPEVAMLVDLIERERPGVVVECGSGSSTAWIALTLERCGVGEVHALEDDEMWIAETRSLTDALKVSNRVHLHHAPLQKNEHGQVWYAPDSLTEIPGEVDLILVDGPAGQVAADARRPVLSHLVPRLRTGGYMLIDDTDRKAERDLVDACKALEGLETVTDHGTAVLLRRGVR